VIQLDPFWLLVLMAVVGAACFYAGWRASDAHRTAANTILAAATTVSAITDTAAANATGVKGSLDKMAAENASLRLAVNDNTRVAAEKFEALEVFLQRLFEGLERAGVVRRGATGPGLQVGEKAKDE
jgi:hypothetical protein